MSTVKNKSEHGARSHTANRKRRGFTLIELMVVLLIIGLLAGLIGLEVLNRVDEARVTTARSDISNLEKGVQLFYTDNGSLPESLEDLVTEPPDMPNWKKCLDEDSVPVDPWGNEYKYEPGEKREFEVYSLGADGEVGGEDEDADIGYGEEEGSDQY